MRTTLDHFCGDDDELSQWKLFPKSLVRITRGFLKPSLNTARMLSLISLGIPFIVLGAWSCAVEIWTKKSEEEFGIQIQARPEQELKNLQSHTIFSPFFDLDVVLYCHIDWPNKNFRASSRELNFCSKSYETSFRRFR